MLGSPGTCLRSHGSSAHVRLAASLPTMPHPSSLGAGSNRSATGFGGKLWPLLLDRGLGKQADTSHSGPALSPNTRAATGCQVVTV